MQERKNKNGKLDKIKKIIIKKGISEWQAGQRLGLRGIEARNGIAMFDLMSRREANHYDSMMNQVYTPRPEESSEPPDRKGTPINRQKHVLHCIMYCTLPITHIFIAEL